MTNNNISLKIDEEDLLANVIGKVSDINTFSHIYVQEYNQCC
jgi:hypothetical protein